jgi:hypothetical protein
MQCYTSFKLSCNATPLSNFYAMLHLFQTFMKCYISLTLSRNATPLSNFHAMLFEILQQQQQGQLKSRKASGVGLSDLKEVRAQMCICGRLGGLASILMANGVCVCVCVQGMT